MAAPGRTRNRLTRTQKTGTSPTPPWVNAPRFYTVNAQETTTLPTIAGLQVQDAAGAGSAMYAPAGQRDGSARLTIRRVPVADPDVVDLTAGMYRRQYSASVDDRRVAALTLAAGAWYWRVHAAADDFGNAPADPVVLFTKAAGRRAGTGTVDQIGGWVVEMTAAGLLAGYAADGEPYHHLVGWERLQPAGRNGKRVRRFPPSPWDQGDAATTGGTGAGDGRRVEPGVARGVLVHPGESHASGAQHEHEHEHQNQHGGQAAGGEAPPSGQRGRTGKRATANDAVPPIPSTLDTSPFREAWALWQQHRRERRQALTPTATAQPLADVANLGEARAVAAIRHSIASGYQGIYERKPDGDGHQQQRPSPAYRSAIAAPGRRDE